MMKMIEFFQKSCSVIILAVFSCASCECSLTEKEQVKLVNKAEDYFNGIDEFEADFTQCLSKKNNVSTGTIYIKRPHLIRVEYNDPNSNIIIINDEKIIHYDLDLKEKTELPKKASPFSVLTQKNVKLIGKATIKDVHITNGNLYIKIEPIDKNEIHGTLTLIFTTSPFEMRQWIIEDGNENTSSIVINSYKRKLSIKEKEIANYSNRVK